MSRMDVTNTNIITLKNLQHSLLLSSFLTYIYYSISVFPLVVVPDWVFTACSSLRN